MQCLILPDSTNIRLKNPRNFVSIVSYLMMTYSAFENIIQLLIAALIFLMFLLMAFKWLSHLFFYYCRGVLYDGRNVLLPRFIKLHSTLNPFGNKLGYQYVNDATFIINGNYCLHKNSMWKALLLKIFQMPLYNKKRLPMFCIKNTMFLKQLFCRSIMINGKTINPSNLNI